METKNINFNTDQLQNESAYNYDLFCRFLRLGSIVSLFNEQEGKIGLRQLYYISKKYHWKERKCQFTKDYRKYILESEIHNLISIKKKQLKHDIQLSLRLQNIIETFEKYLPSGIQMISSQVSSDPMKILTYFSKINNIIRMYNINTQILNKRIADAGFNLNNISELIDELNFENEEYENIEELITEEEKAACDDDKFLEAIYNHTEYIRNKESYMENLYNPENINLGPDKKFDYNKFRQELLDYEKNIE